MITRTCQQCGVDYDTFPSQKPKYCSSRCAGDAKRNGKHKRCELCNERFYVPKSSIDQMYCSKSCARSAANLTDANPSYHRDISGENNPMYGKGHLISGERNPMYGKTKSKCPNWKGGRKTRPDGYQRIVAPDDHPYPCEGKNSGTKYILEHRRVMEKHLGRYLKPEEVVHHIDGNPRNNSIDNLKLYKSQSDHIREEHC